MNIAFELTICSPFFFLFFLLKLDNNMSLIEFELVPIPVGGAAEAKEETPAADAAEET